MQDNMQAVLAYIAVRDMPLCFHMRFVAPDIENDFGIAPSVVAMIDTQDIVGYCRFAKNRFGCFCYPF